MKDFISEETQLPLKESLLVDVGENEGEASGDIINQKILGLDSVETIANAIDEAFAYKANIKSYTLPTPSQWIGPRLFYMWILPIFAIRKIQKFLYSLYLYLCE